MPKLNLSEGAEYLEALKVAASFPRLFIFCQEHEGSDSDYEHLMDEAMDTIDEWCPHMWPSIDRAILRIVESS